MIIFLVRKIIAAISKQRRTAREKREQQDRGNVAPTDGTNPTAATHDDKPAVYGSIVQPLDETDHSKEKYPPEWFNDEGRSFLGMLIVGFAMAIDFTMSMMSIQALYYVVGGQQNLYGLTFGSYDLTAVVFSPMFTAWSNATKTFMLPCLLGMFINMIGNFLYALTIRIDRWWIMLIGRLVAGAGSAILASGSLYIALTTTFQQRTDALGKYRLSQSFARMVGPFIGYAFLGFPEPDPGSSLSLKLFNFYTIPGWIAGFVALVMMPIFFFMYKEPHQLKGYEEAHNKGTSDLKAEMRSVLSNSFASFFWPYQAVNLALGFSMWGFYSNLFGLFAGQYHAISQQQDIWHVFIAPLVGTIVALSLYRKLPKVFPGLCDERTLLMVTAWLPLAGWLMNIPYKSHDFNPNVWLYYTSTAVVGGCLVVWSVASETFLSKKISDEGGEVQDIAGHYLGIAFSQGSLGRFAGSLVIGAVTAVLTPDGQLQCSGPVEQMCCITAGDYYVDGCVLYHANIYYPIMAGFHFLAALAYTWVFMRHGKYRRERGAAEPTSA